MRRRWVQLAAMLAVFIAAGCATKSDVFQDIGSNLASPTAMWVDVAANRLYLVNSNSEVLYDWRQGNFQVLDITAPTAPVLLNSLETLSYSGELYIQGGIAYTPNRYSDSDSETIDRLYAITIDEASADYMTLTETPLGENPFAIACCYPADRAWITTSEAELQYVDIGGTLTPGSVSLVTTLDTGQTVTQTEASHVALLNNQAFVVRYESGIMVVNLDEVGVAGTVPVDYMITDIDRPRGIATDGNFLYVAGEGNEDGWKRFLLVLDPSSLTPRTDNTDTMNIDKDDDGILVALIEVENGPQEVLVTDAYVFVSNQDSDSVSVIDRNTLALATTIAVGEEPFSLALYEGADGTDRYVYVGNVVDDTISIIDIASLAVVATYP